MSLEDLRRAGILLPEREWGTHDLHTTTSRPFLLGLGVLAAAATIMAYLGAGGILTWIGLGLYLVDLVLFTIHSVHAIERKAEGRREEASDRRG